MTANSRVCAAMLGGYALGRAKKGKLAIGLGLWLMGKRIGIDPKQLGTKIARSPVLGGLSGQARENLLEAGKAAAGTVLAARADSLADTLHERTRELERRDEQDTDDEDAPGAEDVEDTEEDEGRRRQGRRKAAPPARSKATSSPGRGSRTNAPKSSASASRASGGRDKARKTGSGSRRSDND
ncbi:hypothetical protein OIE62_26125 [Streptomyces scopuliridis]|uniref:Uncharacterized protein n=1 Tax=Streptomyces scopuliridis TaxID=452529 RepID=A0ACD4ZK55_9ACTN|nr:hypothetical protein [Streptomyces scopuliridis]WSB98167.1 hypothetical protein OG835_14815 [Streptomyces scopuliridis]WSC08131.1 hypothetical protein OIE62_26125 [Streptomyces scopuliridis]